jgi:hypothetical protein
VPEENQAATKPPRMNRRTRRTIGVANAVEGSLALASLVAAYGFTERLAADQEAAGVDHIVTRTAHWLGPDFPVTLSMSLIIVGAAAGFVGSVIQQSIVFAQRAGLDTLQQGFVWWYVLRPVWSALLGAIVVIGAHVGLVSIGDQTTSAAGVTVLVNLGCLAGLFTDQVLQRLQNLLGAEDHRTLLGHGGASAAGDVAASGIA